MRKGPWTCTDDTATIGNELAKWIKSLAIAYHHLPDVGEHASVRDLERRLYNFLSSEQIDVFVQFWNV